MDRMTAAQLKELDDKQLRVLTGTVYSGSNDASALQVTLDNNSEPGAIATPVTIPSLCGPLPAGTRVSILVFPPSGMVIVGVIGLEVGWLRDFNGTWVIRRAYIANDTWTKPTHPLFLGVQVMLQGGGGGSGGTAAWAGAPPDRTSCSGGGQGGYFLEIAIRAENLTDTCSVIVGAGGTAAAAGNNAGGTGGTSEFRDDAAVAYGTAPGGAGGAGGGTSDAGQTTQNGGSGVQTATVDTTRAVSLDFQQGDDGLQGFRYLGGTATGIIMPGSGGGSRLAGITRIQVLSSDQIAPAAGYAFGGGASGRGVRVAGNFAAGGGAAGGQGIVMVKEYYRV